MDEKQRTAGRPRTHEDPVSATGFTVLFEPLEPSIDVVFVHGFTGHPEKTWTHTKGDVAAAPCDSGEPPSKKQRLAPFSRSSRTSGDKYAPVYWPRDLLPDALPNARILTYGYDTHLRHHFQGPGPKSTVYDMAWNFLLQLGAERDADSSRPLLFVAHSLGGILVKEALRRSERCQSNLARLRDVFTSTTALIFFGTPHGGADPRGALHKLLERAIRGLGVSVNNNVVDTLLGKSDRLEELRNEFNPLARQRNWSIYSFQEELGVPLLFNRKVVEDTASSLLIDCETTQRISRNHMDMCRFTGNNDSEYKKVVHAIRNLAAHSLAILPKSPEIAALDKPKSTSPTLPAEKGLTEEEKIAFAFIEKLKFPQIDSRKMGIRRAHSKTCQWLLESRQYQDWLDDEKLHDHYGLLWMKGKPGTGKSTIMKFTDHKFRESRFGQHTVTISFFFNARGTELEKSTLGMYRALLVQLLTINSKLKSIFKQAGLERWNLLDENIWTLELLEVLFEKAVASLGDLSAVCFIDALDECDESQVRKMVRSLEHIVKTANLSRIKFRVFISSRYYPQITTEVGLELLLDRQKGHDQDIEAYVESELRIGSCAIAAKIRDELKEKSQGVFMWVVLVTEMLSTEFDRGRHPRQLQQKLREIPDDLHQLYRSILMRDTRDQDELLLCLQWLLFAREPIAPQQFYLLMQVSGDADLSGGLEETSMAMIEKYIRNVSKGVAEVAKSYTVQFIHESVRDFLLKEDGLRDLWPDRTENPEGEGHDRLKQCCYHVLMFDLSSSPLYEEAMTSPAERIRRTAAVSLRDQARMRFSLLGYAVRNILQHSEEAESRNVDQMQFIHNFPLRRWTYYYYQFNEIRASRYTSQTSLLYVLAELGLSSLVTKHTDPQACLTLEPGNFLTPLFAALASGPRSESTVKVLLEALSNQKGPNFPSTSWYEQWQSQGRIYFRAAETDKFPPALSIAAVPLETNNDILFEYPAHFSKGEDWIENGRHALIRAIMMGRADIVRLLLEGGCSPNYWRRREGIRVAAAKGCDKTVSLLLNSGADTKAKNYDEELSPLVLAARSGHTSVVSLLLERGCFKEPQALHLAAEEGHSDVVSFLLKQSYDANAVDLFGRTPLMLAARAGRTSTVSLLLGQGMGSDGQEAANRAVSINAACCGGRTALSYSAEAGFPEAVSLLLENEHVDLNFADIKGRAALSYAAEKDCVDVVKLLIGSKGVELNLPDKAGRTPLSYAAQYGCLEVVRLLLGSRGVEIDLQDPSRRTPLSYTVSGRNSNVVEEMVQLFIRTGKVNVDASDYEGRTPLSYAAEADGDGTIPSQDLD